jgi:hypothetical protein
MQTFDQSLLELVRDGLVSEPDARAVATSPHDFALALGSSEPAGELVVQGAVAPGIVTPGIVTPGIVTPGIVTDE